MVQVYFHNTGQLLFERDKRQNLILPATKENVKTSGNSLYVYDTVVILKMERQLKLDVQDYQSYDKCIMDYGTEVLGDDLMKCFFSKSYNCSDIISNSSVTLFRNLLRSQNKCTPPQNILLTSADKSVSLKYISMQSEDIGKPEYGGLGIKDNPHDEKPKIEFFFPKFTKMSQVTLFLSLFNK